MHVRFTVYKGHIYSRIVRTAIFCQAGMDADDKPGLLMVL